MENRNKNGRNIRGDGGRVKEQEVAEENVVRKMYVGTG